MEKLELVMRLLIAGGRLPFQYRDHPLHGEWKDRRDCHIEADWTLVYELKNDDSGNELIIFHATDTHSNLFK